MKLHPSFLVATTGLLLTVAVLAQDAKKLRAQAEAETNQEKQVVLLCKAADLEPKNADFRKDCTERKASLVTSDRQSLKTAQDAADAGQVEKAKRYAKYVTGLDPDLHQQAQQLIAKLTTPAQPAAPPAPAGPSPSTVALGQAQTAFESGNLQAAKGQAEQVTDAALKPIANHLVGEIDNYTNLVNTGRSHEEAKEYAQAISAYQSALGINSHVGSDSLNDKIGHLRQLASAPPPPVAPTPTPTAPSPVVARNNVPATPTAKSQEQPSLEAKKDKLLDAYAMAVGRKDLEGADRSLRQIVLLDPHDMDAKNHLADVEKQLAEIVNRDPVKLEKTLHDAIAAFYASQFEDAESDLNRYIGADAGKKKGTAYFYLGATEEARALLESSSKHASREAQARGYFKQARQAGYQPVQKYVSEKILQAWQQTGM